MDTEESTLNTQTWSELYKESAQEYRYFLDWRHRIMLRHAVMFGAIALIAPKIYVYAADNFWLAWAPALVWSTISALAALLDMKNGILARRAGNVCRSLEKAAQSNSTIPIGFHSQGASTASIKPSYDQILQIWYWLQAAFGILLYILGGNAII